MEKFNDNWLKLGKKHKKKDKIISEIKMKLQDIQKGIHLFEKIRILKKSSEVTMRINIIHERDKGANNTCTADPVYEYWKAWKENQN